MTVLSPYMVFKLKLNCQNSHQLLAEVSRLYSHLKAELGSVQIEPGTGQTLPWLQVGSLCLLGQPLLPRKHHTGT